MGLPTEILKYFHTDRVMEKIFTFGDFLIENEGRVSAVNLNKIIQRLLLEGLLIDLGGDWEHNPRNAKFQTINYLEELANYGVYDYFIGGFPLIRQTFSKSVVLFQVKLSTGEPAIGTGFLLEYRQTSYLLTAKHNVLNHSCFKILRTDNLLIRPTELWITYDEEFEAMLDGLIDIAILKIEPNNISDIKPFQLDNWKVLDDVLTIGFPPIPGFDAIQFSETAAIVALKSTTGQITGEGNSYIGKQDYFLISARVKGGNSGGPVINKIGKVVGMVADTPEQDNQMDTMGFGVVTPMETITKALNCIRHDSTEIRMKQINMTQDNEGWVFVENN
jgi:serine protease Do